MERGHVYLHTTLAEGRPRSALHAMVLRLQLNTTLRYSNATDGHYVTGFTSATRRMLPHSWRPRRFMKLGGAITSGKPAGRRVVPAWRGGAGPSADIATASSAP